MFLLIPAGIFNRLGPIIQRLIRSLLFLEIVAQDLSEVVSLGPLSLRLIFWSKVIYGDDLDILPFVISSFHRRVKFKWVSFLPYLYMIELVESHFECLALFGEHSSRYGLHLRRDFDAVESCL